LLVIWGDFWCPEEDVKLCIVPFIYSRLLWFRNIKAVPEVVPISICVAAVVERFRQILK
jgi:hypothetical protein